MDVLSSGEHQPGRDPAQTQPPLDELHVPDDELAAFESFDLPGDGEVDVADAFGEHAIEYWVWNDNRLIPASPMKLARIHEFEALNRLAWQKQREAERASKRDPLATPIPEKLLATVRNGAATFAKHVRGLARHAHADHAARYESQHPEPERSPSYEHRPPG